MRYQDANQEPVTEKLRESVWADRVYEKPVVTNDGGAEEERSSLLTLSQEV